MAAVIQWAVKNYCILVNEYSDPRTRDLFLAGSPLPVLALLFLYYRFVSKWGPDMMKHRKPFNVDRLVQVYNIFQVVTCVYFVAIGYNASYGSFGQYSWKCEPIDHSNSERALIAVRLTWYYYLMKLSDLMDTVFFVVRKKYSQITALHLYHHMGMVGLGYASTKYVIGGHGTLVGLINCSVHAVMYSYYFLTNYDPKYKKNLWWKKYITQLQILQFLVIIVHLTPVLFQPDCEYPKWAICVFLPNQLVMLYMFCMFYKKSYMRPKTKDP